MISSAKINSTDNKPPASSDAEEPKPDEFANLLSGFSLIAPPVAQPVTVPTDETAGGTSSIESLDEVTNSSAQSENVGDVEADKADNQILLNSELFQKDILNNSQAVTSALAPTDVEPAPNKLADLLQLADKSTDETSLDAKSDKKEKKSEEGFISGDAADDFTILPESKTSSEGLSLGASDKNPFDKSTDGESRKLPKTFKEITTLFESSTEMAGIKHQAAVENAAPMPEKAVGVVAQLEPQVLQMALLADKTAKPQLLKMRLNPAELGMVEVSIEKDSAGKIRAHFQTEREDTKHILTESIDQLRDSLQNAGWQVEHIEVSNGSFASAGQEHRDTSSRQSEAAQRSSVNSMVSESLPTNKDNLNSEKSNRLLSVRA